MKEIEKDIKNLEMIKDMIDTEYGKGKEIVKALDDAVQMMQKSIEKENKE